MIRLNTLLGAGTLVAGLMFATACQFGVERDTKVTSQNQVLKFEGFTQVPSSSVTIEVFNKATKNWQWIGTAKAGTGSINAKDGQDKPIKLFFWSFDFKLSDQFGLGNSNWRCFVNEQCFVWPDEEKIQFRFHTADQGIQFAYNFGQGGGTCMTNEWLAGTNVVTTYNDCKNVSDESANEIPLGVTYVIKPQGFQWDNF
jgi:hypothetical protein